MTTGLDDLQNISDARKTVVINDELLRLKIDIAALQETRLADSGTLKEKDYTFFWQGKSAEHHGPISFISAYAPTLTSTPEAKDEVYSNLNVVIKNIPNNEQLVLLGDSNARVGADQDSWPSCLGSFGVAKVNDNGQRLLEFCSYHGLCVTNTFFQTKPQHRVSWRHPRSKHWHQLDMIIVRRTSLKHVLLTRTCHRADCDTDHSLVCCKIRLTPKTLHRAKPQGKPRINTIKMQQEAKIEEFAKTFEEAISTKNPQSTALDTWIHLRECIHTSALAIFGKMTSRSSDWFDAKSAEMTPVIEAKRAALTEYKRSPSEKTLKTLSAARSKVQQTARKCANEYWQELSRNIQTAAETGNIRGMYDGITKALGPTQSKTAPLKSISGEVITDKGKQMERWVEHYSELYSRENSVVDSALDAIEPLPIMEDLDAEPTLAFDLVSRDGLFNILLKIGCPPNLYSMIRSFHDDMKAACPNLSISRAV
ncbi:uncharacterized protein [Montipora foliosa]|uniref:uncharacterized protein n=1 Tax=Montipora foliosa TaxID=591990 RepID=UPI0035F129F6